MQVLHRLDQGGNLPSQLLNLIFTDVGHHFVPREEEKLHHGWDLLHFSVPYSVDQVVLKLLRKNLKRTIELDVKAKPNPNNWINNNLQH